MELAYIGFSSIGGHAHKGAAHSGIAQSDFTHKLLSEVAPTKYFICFNECFENRASNGVIPVILRTGFLKWIQDSSRLFFRLKKEGPFKKIIIYHSFLFFPLILMLKLSGLKITLQVNEVFTRAGSHNSVLHLVVEKLIFFLSSDYILATSQLLEYLPQSKIQKLKTVPIIPGPISCPKNTLYNKYSSCSRLVYAGIIDKKKLGGAFIALQLARLLDDKKYTLDLFGFGLDDDIKDLIEQIRECNLVSQTKVRYMGELPHKDLVSNLTNYDVGLATQYIGTEFSASSFPSKILTYLSAGLHIVCATSMAVNRWDFKSAIFIYTKADLSDLLFHIKSLGTVDKSTGRFNVVKIRKSMLLDLERLIL